jgi:hypothetical protein
MKTTVFSVILLILCMFFVQATFAQPTVHTKVLPYSLRYPLIRPVPYESIAPDPYKRAFGVNRLLKGFSVDDIARSLRESYSWYYVYGSYGVNGCGEDVFTARAARIRQRYRDE